MKKPLALVLAALLLGVGFFAGRTHARREELQRREQACHTMTVFAIDKAEDLALQYDADTMEALISDVYAAYLYAGDSALSYALHDLWNALLFDGENIIGNEDALIEVLKNADPQEIKDFATGLRLKNRSEEF